MTQNYVPFWIIRDVKCTLGIKPSGSPEPPKVNHGINVRIKAEDENVKTGVLPQNMVPVGQLSESGIVKHETEVMSPPPHHMDHDDDSPGASRVCKIYFLSYL